MIKSIDWIALRACIMIEQNNICAICGKTLKDSEFTLHHIIPRSKNGKDELSNLIGLCDKCHDIAEEKELNREEINNYWKNHLIINNSRHKRYIRKSYFIPEEDNPMKYRYPEEIFLKDSDKYIIEKKHKEDVDKEEEFYKIVNAKYEYTPRELLLYFGFIEKKHKKKEGR